MATPGIPQQPQQPGMTALHTGAIVAAILSGICAAVALVAGTPFQFGAALALCGAGWIVADFIEWTDERERALRRCAVLAGRPAPGSGSCHAAYVGGGEYFSRPAHRAGTGLAA
jgi:hypothetical protein